MAFRGIVWALIIELSVLTVIAVIWIALDAWLR